MLTPYGLGTDACWEGLCAGRSAIAPVERFNVSAFNSSLGALIPGLDSQQNDSLVMQMLKQLAPANIPSDAHLLLATTTGEVDLLERSILEGRGEPFVSALNNLLAKCIELFGCASGEVISSACISSTAALAVGSAMIREGERECVLVVACDAVTEFVFSGFSSLMALDASGAHPFDAERAGLSVGEGAAYALLMSGARAAREHRSAQLEICGWGLSSDANHMTGPSRDGSGLAQAMNDSLRLAGIEPTDVGFISAHGTGTRYNDSMEMLAFKSVFGAPRPLFSIKGGMGHSMGVTGLIETLLVAKCFESGFAPPTVGLRSPGDDAAGWITEKAVAVNGEYAITTNAGFGGVNASLVLKKVDAMPSSRCSRTECGGGTASTLLGVRGVGWINERAYGGSDFKKEYAERIAFATLGKEDGLFAYPVKNFGRFETLTQRVCYATALALRDAGIKYAEGRKLNIGVLGATPHGAVASNRNYFQDYVDGGRTLSRANLFIYTLPSSPFAEAAVHFGLTGPLLYGNQFEPMVSMAQRMIRRGEADSVLVYFVDECAGLCALIGRTESPVCSLDDLKKRGIRNEG